MDRMQELNDILNEPTPPALETSVKRAKARYKKSRVGRWCGIPVASLAGAAALFVLLVNTSIPFARACGGIPILKEFAAAVAFSPSLKAAVENDYVQLVGQEQTVNGVTMKIEYIIADKRQVNIFYSITDGEVDTFFAEPEITDLNGERFASSEYGGSPSGARGELRKLTANFLAQDTPSSFRFSLSIWKDGYQKSEPVAQFSTDVNLDPAFLKAGRDYPVNQTVMLDGQSVTVKRVEVYPTHATVTVTQAESNTASVRGLDLSLVDEAGHRAEGVKNGISASDVGARETVYYLESNYFWTSKELTVEITGASLRDKGSEYVTLDLENGVALDALPQGVTLGAAIRWANRAEVVLFGQEPDGNDERNMVSYSIVGLTYYDPEGGEHQLDGTSTTHGEMTLLPNGERLTIPEGCFTEEFTLHDYPWDSVELEVLFSRRLKFAEPVTVTIK